MAIPSSNPPKSILIVEAKFEGGQPNKGPALAPELITQSILNDLPRLDLKPTLERVVDNYKSSSSEDQEELDNLLHNSKRTAEFTHNVFKTIEKASKETFVMTLGGDHSVSIGSIAAMVKKYPDLVIIYMDAHPDIHTDESTLSGNTHGTTLGFLTKRSKLPEFQWLYADTSEDYILPCKNIGLYATRSIDSAERAYIKEHNIKTATMTTITEKGMVQSLVSLLNSLDPEEKCPIHLSFDVDCIDPIFVPSTGTKVPGGLLSSDARWVCEFFHNTGRLVSIDVTEYNPMIGSNSDSQRSLEVIRECVLAALGNKLL